MTLSSVVVVILLYHMIDKLSSVFLRNSKLHKKKCKMLKTLLFNKLRSLSSEFTQYQYFFHLSLKKELGCGTQTKAPLRRFCAEKATYKLS